LLGCERKPRADRKKLCTAKVERGFPSNEEASPFCFLKAV
jgi:hypothetical protein